MSTSLQALNNAPSQSPSMGLMEDDIIGVIKIKDGLFICDEFGA